MKQEPELVDVFAMLAMMVIMHSGKKGSIPMDIARSAYYFAEAMMEEREERNA